VHDVRGFPLLYWTAAMTQQLIANGIVAGSIYALTALGFALIYGTARFFHFAHAAVITAGAYAVLFGCERLGLSVPLASLLAIAVCGVLGCAMEICCYRPLRRRKASPLVLLLASLGMYVVLQNLISLMFGDNPRVILVPQGDKPFSIMGARLMPVHMAIILTSLALVLALAGVLRATRVGRATRAVADDPTLALVCGVDAHRLLLFTFAIGSVLGGAAGILIALDVGMTPHMGMSALLMGVVATIGGGVGSIPGAAAGGLLLGLAQHFSVWMIGSEWQDSIAFAILLAFLIFRPYGIFGRKLGKVEI